MSIAPAMGFLLCCSAALISLGGQWTAVTLDLAMSATQYNLAHESNISTVTTPVNITAGSNFKNVTSNKDDLDSVLFKPRLWYSIVRSATYFVGLLLVICPQKGMIIIYATASALFAVFAVSLKFVEDWIAKGVPIFLGLTSFSGTAAVICIFAMVPGEFSPHSAAQDIFLGFLVFSLKAGTDWLLWGVTHLRTDVMPSTSPTTPSPSAVETVSLSEVTFLPCLANIPVAAVAAFVWFLERNKPAPVLGSNPIERSDSKLWRADACCFKSTFNRRNGPMISVIVNVLACSVVRHVAFLTLLAKIDEELTSSAGKDYRIAFSLTFIPDILGTLLAVGVHAKKSPVARYAAPVGAFFFSGSVAAVFLVVKFMGTKEFWAFVVAEMWIRLFHQVFLTSAFLSIRRMKFRQSQAAQFVAFILLLLFNELGHLTSEFFRDSIPTSLEPTEYRLILGASVACMVSLSLLTFGKTYGEYIRLRTAHVAATDDIVYFHSGNRSTQSNNLAMAYSGTTKSFVFEPQHSTSFGGPADTTWSNDSNG